MIAKLTTATTTTTTTITDNNNNNNNNNSDKMSITYLVTDIRLCYTLGTGH